MAAPPVNPSPRRTVPRIVGVGASAGGLDALEQFLENAPPKSGLAYLIVQHLDPTKKALLAELLQRVTPMTVREAVGEMPVESNNVYVIPPNTELSVADGVLRLTQPAEPHGLRLPINILFSSLAREQGAGSIAAILSGMGSDGTVGAQAIHSVGGLVVAQDPVSAQFDSMPSAVIAAGLADIIAEPAELPARILAYIAHGTVAGPAAAAVPAEELTVDPLQSIFRQLQQHTRHDFSLYKPNTLHRRIERRMAIHGINTLESYEHFLRQNPQEIELLFKELLIGVTCFFRDPLVWQQFAEVTLPGLLAQQPEGGKLRAWVVGCSTGEEAYTVAMLFAEAMQGLQKPDRYSLQIFASDLSADALATARCGQYAVSINANVSPERLARFFTLRQDQYQVTQEIRDMVLFAQHDVVLDPPFTKLHLLSCRNLMIYFDAALQRRLLPLFHYSLRPEGVLLLGSSETVGRFSHLFAATESKLRLYKRRLDPSGLTPEFLITSFPPLLTPRKGAAVSPKTPTSSDESLQSAADRVLLQTQAPPAVVVNGDGDVVYISGRTGKYLEPAAGKTNWNFYAMAREGLRASMVAALKQSASQSHPVEVRGLKVQAAGGEQIFDVTLQLLQEPDALRGMVMIVFRDVAAVTARRGRHKGPVAVESSDAIALQRSREEIQALREETRASKEELQSANEELQSTNEELQSANEELTTSKEEMQSMNEELQTVNAEMQKRLDDLALAQSDMKNLLNSTDIAMLFLDKKLNVRRFTERASKIINLRDSDIGRPLSDLTTTLQYPTLHEDANDTLRTLVYSEKQIHTSDARWFSVRIMPYRRLDNVIDGAVITFVDITATKALESTLRSKTTP